MARRLVRDPMYQQVNHLLRDLIRTGEFRANQQFLTERRVCERFQVSRATANKALSTLVAEGVLEFRKGIGTFVRGELLDYDVRSLVSFTEKARAAGKEPSTRVLSFETLPAERLESEVAQRLGLDAEDRVHSMRRLRLADGEPVILETRFIRAEVCPDLSAEDVGGSLYAVWTDRLGLDIAGAAQTIRAVSLPDPEARLLGAASGAAGLVSLCTGFLEDGSALWWERTLYRGDAYEFRNRLGGIRRHGPAVGALTGTDSDRQPEKGAR
jgi:DNA-binding GntR family transcriptional regulator